MRKKLAALVLIFTLSLVFTASASAEPKRIISVTPVGTEILYALGLEENIVAVTNYCDYPPEAQKKEKIGGFTTINLESIVAKKADLVVLQDIHESFIPQLEELKIPYVLLTHGTLEEICTSIIKLGKVCDREKKAAEMVGSIRADVEYVRKKVAGQKKPSCMVCIRDTSVSRITSFHAAGRSTCYSDIIEKAGGKNALSEKTVHYSQVSQEGLIMLNPDVIFDMIGDSHFARNGEKQKSDEEIIKQWQGGVKVNAVKNGRIYVLRGTAFLRPGPRIGQVIKEFAKVIHPEVSWEAPASK